jgi:hypothetical protein
MTRVQVYASDQALHTIALSREEAAEEDDRAATDELLAAVAELCHGWLQPLAVGMLLECCDPANFYQSSSELCPVHPKWFLRQAELDPRVILSTGYSEPVERSASAIDAATLAQWVGAALEQSCEPETHVVAFAELTFTAVAVRIPSGVEVALSYPGGPLQPCVVDQDEGQIALGPIGGPVGAPIRLRAVNDHGVTHIELGLYWDLWIEHPQGRALVEAGVSRVLQRARGWTRTPDPRA